MFTKGVCTVLNYKLNLGIIKYTPNWKKSRYSSNIEWMDKQDVVCEHNGTLFGNEKEQTSDIWYMLKHR